MARALIWLVAALALAAAARPAAADFALPSELPYDGTTLEPSIDALTMDLHYNRHSAAFVNNLNTQVLPTCPEVEGWSLTELVQSVGATRRCNSLLELRALGITAGIGKGRCPVLRPECETIVRNNAGGLWNHGAFFLHNLAPFGSQSFEDDTSRQLRDAIKKEWGSFEGFKAAFTSAAGGVFGSGWAWLVADPDSKRLSIVTTPNQDNPLMPVSSEAGRGGLPILGLDVWEHAYYLKYYNVRASYINAFYSVINWRGVSALYGKAVQGARAFARVDVLQPAANWD